MKIATLIFIIASVSSQWSFKVKQADDGAFLPDWKDKKIGYAFGEDSFVTTPYGIAIADGVGGSDFASLHIARHLTTSFGQWILGCIYEERVDEATPSDFCKTYEQRGEESTILGVMNQIMNRKVETTKGILERLENPKGTFDQSSTFVSAHFSGEGATPDDVATLNIFQKGDSLALVLRFDKESKNWKPYAYTSDDQFQFNMPYQYVTKATSNVDEHLKDNQNRFLRIVPEENDVVILGSDGLFDNIPVSMITMAFNSLVKTHYNGYQEHGVMISKNDLPNTRISLKTLISAYKRLISKLTVEEMTQESVKKESLFDADDFKENLKKKEEDPLSKSVIFDSEEKEENPLSKSVIFGSREKEENPLSKSSTISSEERKREPKGLGGEGLKRADSFDEDIEDLDNDLEDEEEEFEDLTSSTAFKAPPKKETAVANADVEEDKDSFHLIGEDEYLNKISNPPVLEKDDGIDLSDLTNPEFKKIPSEELKDLSKEGAGSPRRKFAMTNEDKELAEQLRTHLKTMGIDDFPIDESIIDDDSLTIASDITDDEIVPSNKCKTKNLFQHFSSEKGFDKWALIGPGILLDFCFEQVLDKMFRFDNGEELDLKSFFNAKMFSASIAEFAKEMTLESKVYVSPFWAHFAKYLEKVSAVITIDSYPKFMTKPDDITVIAALVTKEDIRIDEKILKTDSSLSEFERVDMTIEIDKAKRVELGIADRITFMDKRNKMEYEQDLHHRLSFY